MLGPQACRPYVLARAGHDASGDMWEQLDNLTNYEEAIGRRRLPVGDRARHRPLSAPARPAAAGRRRCSPGWQD